MIRTVIVKRLDIRYVVTNPSIEMAQITAPNISRITPHALTNPLKFMSISGSDFVTFGGLNICTPGNLLITEKRKQT